MKVVFDFDDVLFDTKAFKERIFEVLVKSGVANARDLYQQERLKERPFSLDQFLRESLVESDPDSVSLLHQEIMKDAQRYVNKEIVMYMTSLGKENCFIVTNGDESFQKEKIIISGVSAYVKQYYIVPGTKRDVIHDLCTLYKDEGVLFVDDKQKFFDDVDKDVCKNLEMVLFDDTGYATLLRRVEELKIRENKSQSLPMR